MRINLRNKVLSNSIWMILEKVISIFGLIFVTSYVAKYIGPANYGNIICGFNFYHNSSYM